jgi:hypothetical protein
MGNPKRENKSLTSLYEPVRPVAPGKLMDIGF